jgi:hypothetical protein
VQVDFDLGASTDMAAGVLYLVDVWAACQDLSKEFNAD